MSSELEIEDVNVWFGGLKAVDNVSLVARAGSTTGLIGPNGAGKSTLFNCVSGLVRPDSGSIRICGIDVVGMPVHARVGTGVARGFQETRVLQNMSVIDNVMVGAQEVRGEGMWAAFRGGASVRGQEHGLRARAGSLLDWVGLNVPHSTRARELSYGQQKILSLCQLLMSDAPILMLDEPVAGVRRELIDSIALKIGDIARMGKTVLMVEHNMPFVWSVCSYVYVLAQGAVLIGGTPQEVREHKDVIRAYLGHSTRDMS